MKFDKKTIGLIVGFLVSVLQNIGWLPTLVEPSASTKAPISAPVGE